MRAQKAKLVKQYLDQALKKHGVPFTKGEYRKAKRFYSKMAGKNREDFSIGFNS